jgi:hypothetical protein
MTAGFLEEVIEREVGVADTGLAGRRRVPVCRESRDGM